MNSTSSQSSLIFDILSEFMDINELNPRSPEFHPVNQNPVNGLNPRSNIFVPQNLSYIEENSTALSNEFDIENGWNESTTTQSITVNIERTSIWSQISNFIRDIIDEPPILPTVVQPITTLTPYSYEDTESLFYNELWGNEEIVILSLE